MGQSTDGILVCGVDLGEGCDLPEAWQGYEDEDGDYCEFELEDFIEETTGTVPAVELVRHCHYDYVMYILAIPGTEICASRGDPEVIDPAMFEVDPQKIQAFKSWFERNIPEAERETFGDTSPRWLLCSMWG